MTERNETCHTPRCIFVRTWYIHRKPPFIVISTTPEDRKGVAAVVVYVPGVGAESRELL